MNLKTAKFAFLASCFAFALTGMDAVAAEPASVLMKCSNTLVVGGKSGTVNPSITLGKASGSDADGNCDVGFNAGESSYGSTHAHVESSSGTPWTIDAYGPGTQPSISGRVSSSAVNYIDWNLTNYISGSTDNPCVPDVPIGEVYLCEAVCGDTFLDYGEQCDDGNNTPGDGCDAVCLTEATPGPGAAISDMFTEEEYTAAIEDLLAQSGPYLIALASGITVAAVAVAILNKARKRVIVGIVGGGSKKRDRTGKDLRIP